MDVDDDVVVLSGEIRFYLRARSRADVENDTRPYQKRVRAIASAWIAQVGGLEAVISGLIEPPPPRTVRPASHCIADMLLLEDESTRNRYEDIAIALWAKADFAQRIYMLGCFPHRADWASELASHFLTVPGVQLYWEGAATLLATLHDRAQILSFVERRGVTSDIVNIIPALREKAAPILGDVLPYATSSSPQRGIACGLSCIGTREVADIFAKGLRRQHVRPYALKFFAQFPHLAKDALTELAKNRKTQAGDVAHAILESIERALLHTESSSPSSSSIAGEDELPPILRELPWRIPRVEPATEEEPKKKRIRKPRGVIVDLETPKEPCRLHWSEHARRRWIAHRFRGVGTVHTEEEIQKLQADLAAGYQIDRLDAAYPKEILFPILRNPPDHVNVWHATPAQILALHGDEALEIVLDGYEYLIVEPVRMLVESPRIAHQLASHDMQRVTQIKDALKWLERYPEAAALGLIPAALGSVIKTRSAAETGLRHIAHRGHRSIVERCIESFGDALNEDARSAIYAVIDSSPVTPPKYPPQLRETYRSKELRAPRLKNGKTFALDAMERLDELLCAYATDPLFYRFDEIRDACEPRSLAEHAWDLVKAWDMNNAPSSMKWALTAVQQFGDDEVVRRLTPALKSEAIPWMLALLGTDAAVMELVTIYARAKRRAATSRSALEDLQVVVTALDRLVATRGVDALEDLVDRFVPTYPVNRDGTITLDLGPNRVWKVTFNAQLRRILMDENNEIVAALPRTKADPEKLRAATTLLEDLDEDVEAIAELRAVALERAMVTSRAWAHDHFRAAWIDHPVMRHMARGVVWEARYADGREGRSFRVAEDSSFADANDDTVDLDEAAVGVSIGVAHPVRLDRDTRNRWRTTFADYKLLQPFEQLGRDLPAISETDLDKTELGKDRATPIAHHRDHYRSMRVVPHVLERAGWMMSATDSRELVIPFGGEPATYGFLNRGGDRITASLVRAGKEARLRDVDAIARCELLRALDIVSAGDLD